MADEHRRTERALSYEQAREELVETVRKLETGGITLEESLALWERGEHLANVCQQWLDGVRERLDKTLGDEDEARLGRANRLRGEQPDELLLVRGRRRAVDQQRVAVERRRGSVE